MPILQIRSKVVEILQNHWRIENAADLINPNLFANTIVTLPLSVLRQAQDFVHEAFRIRDLELDGVAGFSVSGSSKSEAALMALADTESADPIAAFDPGNYSICMSYDFHLDPDKGLRLIEINTNAAFLGLGDVMYQASALPHPVSDYKSEELGSDIRQELEFFGKTNSRPRVAIVDENPQAQKLYIEFLYYQKLFQSWGWDCEIRDISSPLESFDFIYNRSTDFFFSGAASRELRQLYLQKKVCVSPNPHEYFLLADKKRLSEWSHSSVSEKIKLCLLQSEAVTEENAEAIWSKRKSLFFKPAQSFGSKQSFKGASISRKLFDEIRVMNPILAQEYSPASELQIGEEKFKYDLRFYAYKDRVQSVVARLYQGQVTNLKTPGGGFAPVVFS